MKKFPKIWLVVDGCINPKLNQIQFRTSRAGRS